MSASLRLAESTAPATPPSGYAEIYVKSDGIFYIKNDAGAEVAISFDVGALAAAAALALDDSLAMYDLSATAQKGITVQKLLGFADPTLTQGRLTLATGTPITTSDQTAKTRLYFTPYLGNRISLYDGSAFWKEYALSEIYIDIGTLASTTPHDVFVYDNAGTLTLELLIWTNVTTPVALATQDGVFVKAGATTRKWIGTIYPPTTTTMEDSLLKRYVINIYNQVPRKLKFSEAGTTWSGPAAGTTRLYNNNTNDPGVRTVIPRTGYSNVYIEGVAATDLTAGEQSFCGIGVAQSATLSAVQAADHWQVAYCAAGATFCVKATLQDIQPAEGLRSYSLLEATIIDTPVFLGTAAAGGWKSGLNGWVMG